jgi:ATP-dependent Clp protease ATP-binding subunit ClpC
VGRRNQEYKRYTVSEEDVASVVSMMTGVPVTKIAAAEVAKLKLMGDQLKDVIIGQDTAIDKLVKAIKRSRLGLKDPQEAHRFVYLPRTNRSW